MRRCSELAREARLGELAARGLPWSAGLLDHGLWSATTFVLTIAAGRSTGPEGLGAVTVGFAAALLVLGLSRSILLDPYLASGSSVEQARGAGAVLTLSMAAGVASALVCGGVGVLVPGPAGVGLRAFAPFLPLILLQDALRVVAYREDKVPFAASARAAWLACTLALLAGGLRGSAQAVVAAWSLGALPAVLLLASRLRYRPAGLRAASILWSRELKELGGPLGVASVIDGTASQIETYLAAAVAGAAALGGFRAAVSAFAPLTVLRPALGQVGLPKVARAMERDPRTAFRRGATLSGVLLVASLGYAGAAAAYGRLLPLVFGASFARYSDLLLPLTVSQVISAVGVGIHLYLLAAQRGGVMLFGTAVAVPLRLAATVVLGARFGASGLAWAVVVAAGASFAVGAIALGADARRWNTARGAVPEAGNGLR